MSVAARGPLIGIGVRTDHPAPMQTLECGYVALGDCVVVLVSPHERKITIPG